MVSRVWTRRGLLLVAVTAPLGLIALAPSPLPRRETDVRRVYARLADSCRFDDLGRWCALGQTPATEAETAIVRGVILSASELDPIWCGPLVASWQAAIPVGWARVSPHEVRLPQPVKWVRLSDSTDPDRWIGIGVCSDYNTGEWARWVVCRVAVGFSHDA